MLKYCNFSTFKLISKKLIFRFFFVPIWLRFLVISIGKAALNFSEKLKEEITTNLVCSKYSVDNYGFKSLLTAFNC